VTHQGPGGFDAVIWAIYDSSSVMTIREVLLLGNPRLRERSSELVDQGELRGIVDDLRDTLTHLQEMKGIGRGLAAPQIGYLKRVVYVQTPSFKTAMVNPRIVWRSEEVFEIWDSCFSFDIAFYVSISRSRRIRVEYLNGDWVKHTDEFEDGLAELLQHEIDHLDGVLATDHLRDGRDIVMRTEWERRNR
jgi:peptide deformylase